MGLMLLLLQIWRPGDEPDIEHYREVRDLVLDTYVGETSEQELLESALRGMLGDLDGYSRYYAKEETDAINRDTSGKTIGIGIILRFAESPLIAFPVSDSPAETAGLRVGDEILALDGQDVAGLDQEEIGERIQGEVGSLLQLEVQGRDGIKRTHEVKRKRLLVPSVRRVRFLDEKRQVGYFALGSFTNESVDEFDAAVDGLLEDGMQGLVVDLRGNPGGVLAAAVTMARRFVPAGTITSTEGRGRPGLELGDSKQARFVGLPLVLLVDGGSASASEVLAGALQDHRVAVVVGTPSYGKGVVQTITRFTEPNAIAKLTTSYYYTPAHRNVQRSLDDSHAYGLSPDIVISVREEEHTAVVGFIHSFEPPSRSLEELRDWSAETGIELLLDPPADKQLESALALFNGELRTAIASATKDND
ncbi:MAG: carboxyl-terminal processing protease [Candidatus Paceibacteria bacterium]|jgi:carboxyl-terminal processing protease